MQWNCYDDDVIIVTSLVLEHSHYLLERMYVCIVSKCSILPSSFFLQLSSVKQHASCEKRSEQVQQANVFKRQTLTSKQFL